MTDPYEHEGPVSRLAQLRDGRNYLWASCVIDQTCSHYGTLDPEAMIRVLGEDFAIVPGRERLIAALRCSKCGRRQGGAEVRLGIHQTKPTYSLKTVW